MIFLYEGPLGWLKDSGQLGRKLMIRFVSFIVAANLVVLLFVGGHSAYSLSSEIKNSLELHSQLYFQSLEHRLSTVANAFRQMSINRLIVNSLVDPEAAGTYLPRVINEYERSFGISKSLILSTDGQVIYSSSTDLNYASEVKNITRDVRFSDVRIRLTSDGLYFLLLSPITLYNTSQGF